MALLWNKYWFIPPGALTASTEDESPSISKPQNTSQSEFCKRAPACFYFFFYLCILISNTFTWFKIQNVQNDIQWKVSSHPCPSHPVFVVGSMFSFSCVPFQRHFMHVQETMYIFSLLTQIVAFRTYCFLAAQYCTTGGSKLWPTSQVWPAACFSQIKVYWNIAMLIIYTLSMAAFALHQQSWIAAAETLWPAKPKTFTIWPFTEKVANPCSS